MFHRPGSNGGVRALVPLMHLLTWKDFELLVDLVFANSGWRRVGVVGKTQKTIYGSPTVIEVEWVLSNLYQLTLRCDLAHSHLQTRQLLISKNTM